MNYHKNMVIGLAVLFAVVLFSGCTHIYDSVSSSETESTSTEQVTSSYSSGSDSEDRIALPIDPAG